MVQKGMDWVEQTHRLAMQQQLEQERQGRALVEQTFAAVCERNRVNQERVLGLMDEGHRMAAELHRERPEESQELPTVPFIDLPELPADSPIRQEWNTYRCEAPRLIREGLKGKFALIKGDTIIGIFDSPDEGLQKGRELYLMQPFLVQPIREREPLLRIRGLALPCPSSVTRLPRTR